MSPVKLNLAFSQAVLRGLRRSTDIPVTVFHESGSQRGYDTGTEALAVRE